MEDVDVAIQHDAVGLAGPLRIELAVGGHDPVQILLRALVLLEILVQRLELAGLRERAEEQARELNPVEARVAGEELRQDLRDRVAAVVLLPALDADAGLRHQVVGEPEWRVQPVGVLEVGQLDIVEELLARRDRLGRMTKPRRRDARRAESRRTGRRALEELASRYVAKHTHFVSPLLFLLSVDIARYFARSRSGDESFRLRVEYHDVFGSVVERDRLVGRP